MTITVNTEQLLTWGFLIICVGILGVIFWTEGGMHIFRRFRNIDGKKEGTQVNAIHRLNPEEVTFIKEYYGEIFPANKKEPLAFNDEVRAQTLRMPVVVRGVRINLADEYWACRCNKCGYLHVDEERAQGDNCVLIYSGKECNGTLEWYRSNIKGEPLEEKVEIEHRRWKCPTAGCQTNGPIKNATATKYSHPLGYTMKCIYCNHSKTVVACDEKGRFLFPFGDKKENGADKKETIHFPRYFRAKKLMSTAGVYFRFDAEDRVFALKYDGEFHDISTLCSLENCLFRVQNGEWEEVPRLEAEDDMRARLRACYYPHFSLDSHKMVGDKEKNRDEKKEGEKRKSSTDELPKFPVYRSSDNVVRIPPGRKPGYDFCSEVALGKLQERGQSASDNKAFPRYFIHKVGFCGETAYIRCDDNGDRYSIISYDSSALRFTERQSDRISPSGLNHCINMVEKGVWEELLLDQVRERFPNLR